MSGHNGPQDLRIFWRGVDNWEMAILRGRGTLCFVRMFGMNAIGRAKIGCRKATYRLFNVVNVATLYEVTTNLCIWQIEKIGGTAFDGKLFSPHGGPRVGSGWVLRTAGTKPTCIPYVNVCVHSRRQSRQELVKAFQNYLPIYIYIYITKPQLWLYLF